MQNRLFFLMNPNGELELGTLAFSRNAVSKEFLGEVEDRRLEWHRAYNEGYRIIEFVRRIK